MREARDRFLASNGFRIEDYSAPTYTVTFGRLPIRFPNTKAHQWATPLHDLHHILTGYRTDWIGEAETAAWELRAGCKTLVVYWLDAAGAAIGLFISPARVWRAFLTASGQRTLYSDPALRVTDDGRRSSNPVGDSARWTQKPILLTRRSTFSNAELPAHGPVERWILSASF
jgi:hypothetical protein